MTHDRVGRAVPALAVATLLILGTASVLLVDRLREEAPVADRPAAAPSEQASESLDDQLARVARIVAEVRELDFTAPPEVTVVSPTDLRARVADELADYTVEQADLDRRTLELLGAVPTGTDLHALLFTALSEQVAGFYDPDTGELVVGAADPDRRVGRIEEITLAHELQHALADQRLGLPDLDAGEDADAALARQALVEGDATVTMQAYADAGFSPVDRFLLAGESAALVERLAGMTELPHYLQGALLFPYEEGAAFVQTLLADGGWPAVDAAYAEPPRASADILYPERYAAGAVPETPARTTTLTEPWELVRTTTFGAADLVLLFEAPGGDVERGLPDARERARAWRGGRADLYVDGDRSALSLVVASDDPRLCDALTTWLDRADTTARTAPGGGDTAVVEGEARQAVVACAADEVRVGIAGDLAHARTLASR